MKLIRCVFVVQLLSRVWLCDPMDCSTPGFAALPSVLEFAQTMPIESVMLSNHLMLCLPLLLLPPVFPSIRVFSSVFTSGGQSFGASASRSVLLQWSGLMCVGEENLFFLLPFYVCWLVPCKLDGQKTD